jgi:uncharacterized protein YecA (UPF0149 family)
MFTLLLNTINIEMVRALCSLSIESANAAIARESDSLKNQEKATSPKPKKSIAQRPKIIRQPSKLKVGRNDPCPCGSGKKYKQCHG